MSAAVTAAAISAGAGLAQNAFNVGSSIFTNRRNIEEQWKMWNATNEYNHPAAQMARYREAGLNPNLIYGQSNTTTPTNVGIAEAPQVSLQGVGNVMADYMNMKMMDEKIQAQQLDNEYQRTVNDNQKTEIALNNIRKTYDINYTASRIRTEGFNQYLKGLDGQLKSIQIKIGNFEVEDFDRQRFLRGIDTTKKLIELGISKNSYDLGKVNIDNAKIQGNLMQEQISLFKVQQQLMNSQVLLNGANIDLSVQQKLKIEQEINNLKKDFELTAEKINEVKELTRGHRFDNLFKYSDLYNPRRDDPNYKDVRRIKNEDELFKGKRYW